MKFRVLVSTILCFLLVLVISCKNDLDEKNLKDEQKASDNISLTGTITGKVVFENSSTGNAGFLVFISGTSYLTITSDDGTYVLTGVPVGSKYQVAVIKDGIIHIIDSDVTVSANANVKLADNVYTKEEIENTVKYKQGEKGDTGTPGENGKDGNNGANGISIVWLGSFASQDEIENPQILNAFYNMTDGCSYIFNGEKWTLLVSGGKKEDASEIFEPCEVFIVSYQTEFDNAPAQFFCTKGYKLTKEKLPELYAQHYDFNCWLNGEEIVSENYVIQDNTILTAKWSKKLYTITYICENIPVPEPVTVEDETILDETYFPDLTNEQYLWREWKEGDSTVGKGYKVNHNAEFIAVVDEKSELIDITIIKPVVEGVTREYVIPYVIKGKTLCEALGYDAQKDGNNYEAFIRYKYLSRKQIHFSFSKNGENFDYINEKLYEDAVLNLDTNLDDIDRIECGIIWNDFINPEMQRIINVYAQIKRGGSNDNWVSPYDNCCFGFISSDNVLFVPATQDLMSDYGGSDQNSQWYCNIPYDLETGDYKVCFFAELNGADFSFPIGSLVSELNPIFVYDREALTYENIPYGYYLNAKVENAQYPNPKTGDVLIDDGTIVTYTDLCSGNITETQKSKIVGIVVTKYEQDESGSINYQYEPNIDDIVGVLSLEHSIDEYGKACDKLKEHSIPLIRDGVNQRYANDWSIPSSSQIEWIYKQKDLLDSIIDMIDVNISWRFNSLGQHQRYWTSSQANNNGMFVYNFRSDYSGSSRLEARSLNSIQHLCFIRNIDEDLMTKPCYAIRSSQ